MSNTQGDLLGLGQPTTNGPSAGLTLNLSSNNPFRNRASSPNSFSPPPPHSPFDDPPPRPTSRNPFLDPGNQPDANFVTSPDKMASSRDRKSPTAEELFVSILLLFHLDAGKLQSRPGASRPPVNRPPGNPRGAGENAPPRGRGPPPSSSHRPSRSQEEALKSRRMQSGSNSGDRNIAISPQKRPERRVRRNSDSSMIEKPITDEERKRRRERERRHRDPKTGRRLDIIDQLDATSIYGTGLFHHDGPFDACNPHRNRKGSRRAPMQAFAKDSANNSIGGAGPLNAKPDHKLFMGQEPHEASEMYGIGHKEKESSKAEMTFFDPKQRGEYVRGEETLGLGASTFLEGTPAARTAIQRNQAETAQESLEGLGRKKSVVQRFRSIKRVPREYNDSGRVTSPDGGYYSPRNGDLPSANSNGERNPFFNEFDKTEERISVKRGGADAGSTSPVSPPVSSLERRATTDAASAIDGPDGAKQGGNGFLSRVKSLKGGRRQRPEPPSREASNSHPGVAM
ncbi:Pal1-domain-containing protein [Xylariaceae sp. FL0662B]|nr:Pal1-domain-containing protein [Xylariaceae sp. FL0662B]